MAMDFGRNGSEGAVAEMPQKERRMPLWRRVLLVLVIAAMVAVAGLMLTAYLAGRQLGREIVKISERGEPVTFPDLCPGKTQGTAGEDANGCYIESLGQIRPDELVNLMKVNLFYRMNLLSLPASQFPADLHEKVGQTLTKAKPIFAGIDKGAQLALSGFDIGIMRGNQVCRGRLDIVQGAVFLLSLRTLDLVLAGDGEGAAKSIVSTLKLMRVFDTYPAMVVQGRKMMCVGLVCNDIQLLLVQCRPSEDRLKQLQSLLEDAFRSDSLEKMFLAERVYQLEIARNLIPKNVASRYLMTDAPPLPERLELPSFTWHRMRMFVRSVRYLRDMAWLITVSRQPWPEPLDEIVDANSSLSKRSSRLLSVVTPIPRLTAMTLAAIRCTTTAVAIERYRLQYGGIPDSLNVICPRFIESIPLDPFTGKPLLYGRDDESYTVYGTGFNRVDDGGAVTPSQGQTVALDCGIRIRRATAK
jgi:hypothetical protein